MASGSLYIRDAINSATSVKRHNPDLPITIYTDEDPDSDVFDNVVSIDKPLNSMGDSILSERHMPYDRNLYLDTDTYIDGDITDIFNLLDSFDLALAENPGTGSSNQAVYDKLDIEFPTAFPVFNSGVIAYKNNENIINLFSEWNKIYHKSITDDIPHETNQPSLRAALYGSDVRFVTLRNEYNFQINHHRRARGKIKIVHNSGISPVDMESFAIAANSYTGNRVITFDEYPCRVTLTEKHSKKYKLNMLVRSKYYRYRIGKKLLDRYRKDGLFSLLKVSVENLLK